MEKTLPTLKIVVLDDDPNSTELIKVYINHIEPNIKVFAFCNTSEAKEYISSNKFDILFTGYVMPGFNGLQIIESTHPAVKKVLISGCYPNLDPKTLSRLSELKVTCFDKPIPLREIAKIITDFKNEALNKLQSKE